MPYVSESYSSPPATIQVRKRGTATSVSIQPQMSKSQYGYRSRSLTPVEERGIREGNHTAADTVSLLAAYEEANYEYAESPSRAFMVNDRIFSRTTAQHGAFTSSTQLKVPADPNYRVDIGGFISVTGVPQAALQPAPSEGVLRSRSGQMMRRAVPTKSEINLTRSIGELRHAPLMLKASNYRPRNLREVGGAYLNYVFGIAPTLSDLQSLAETVIESDSIIKGYVAQERRRLRRRQQMELWSAQDSGVDTSKSDAFRQAAANTSIGPIPCQVGYILPAGSSYGFDDVLRPLLSWSWSSRQYLRMFVTFEYFVPKPEGLEGRLKRYRQIATRLVGGGLDASTVYDLTPWTWLGNYLVDVGGLLRYQQTVADHQVVATRSGFCLVHETRAQVTYMGRYYDSTGLVGAWPVFSDAFSPCTSALRSFRMERRAGSPYNMQPQWDLSSQQWGILGALGLARSPGVPIKR